MAAGGQWGQSRPSRALVLSFSQVINLDLSQGCQVELREQLEMDWKADRPSDNLSDRRGCSQGEKTTV